MSVFSRDALEGSPLADLHAIAAELGIEGFRRMRKADLVKAIIVDQGADHRIVLVTIVGTQEQLRPSLLICIEHKQLLCCLTGFTAAFQQLLGLDPGLVFLTQCIHLLELRLILLLCRSLPILCCSFHLIIKSLRL